MTELMMRLGLAFSLTALLAMTTACGGKKIHALGHANVPEVAFDAHAKDAEQLSGPNFAIRVKGQGTLARQAVLIREARKFLEPKGFRFVKHTNDANLFLDFKTRGQLKLKIYAFHRGKPQ